MLNAKERTIQQQQFDTAMESIVRIDDNAVIQHHQTHKIPQSTIDLSTVLTAVDHDFAPLMEVRCNKTGRKLSAHTLQSLQQLIHLHGRDKALFLLQCNSISNYAPEWLQTDADSLRKLSAIDPAGYFIYASSFIFHPQGYYAAFCHTEPHDIFDCSRGAAERRHRERGGEPENYWIDLPRTVTAGYATLRDKAQAYDLLASRLSDGSDASESWQIAIGRCNELLRRLLGLNKPNKAFTLQKFSAAWLHELISDAAALEQYEAELTEAIKSLFTRVKEKQLRRGTARQRRQAALSRITSADVASIRNSLQGISCFRDQTRVGSLTRTEAILFDLNGFFGDNEKQLDETQIALRAKPQPAEVAKPKAITKPAGFKLNLKKAAKPEVR